MHSVLRSLRFFKNGVLLILQTWFTAIRREPFLGSLWRELSSVCETEGGLHYAELSDVDDLREGAGEGMCNRPIGRAQFPVS